MATKTSKESAAARLGAALRPVESPLSDFDTQLMLQVREGNSEAASRLVRRNFGRVSAYLSRIVRQQRAVEDLTNDVFLSVLAHAGERIAAARSGRTEGRCAGSRGNPFAGAGGSSWTSKWVEIG